MNPIDGSANVLKDRFIRHENIAESNTIFISETIQVRVNKKTDPKHEQMLNKLTVDNFLFHRNI